MMKVKQRASLYGWALCLVMSVGHGHASAEPTQGERVFEEFSAIVDETCACKDAPCAEGVKVKFESFGKKFEATKPTLTAAQTKALSGLADKRFACAKRNFLLGGPPHTTRPSKHEVLAKVHSCSVQTEGSDVFFLQDVSQLKRIALSGGTPQELARAPHISYFAVSGKDVYYVIGNEILHISRQGGRSDLVTKTSNLTAAEMVGDSQITGLAADSGFVYWSDERGVHRVGPSGKKPSVLTQEMRVDGFVMDDKFVYYFGLGTGELSKVSKSGGSSVKVLGSPRGADWSRLVSKGNYLYGRYSGCGVFRLAKSGGELTRLVTPDPQCRMGLHLSVGETIVFDTEEAEGSRLLEVELKGGTPAQIASSEGICAIAHGGKSLVVSSMGRAAELWKFKR